METHGDMTGSGGAHVDVGRHVAVSFKAGAKKWEDAREIGNMNLNFSIRLGTIPVADSPRSWCLDFCQR